ncbi:MAG: tRNA (guanosine(46)-N7)-methyltransferase TrmB [Fusobacteriaceae bacterium]|nr:tRNA (guanosine(46)-N7)-methyltransferase TrmB [Fusobacteriaceae bacterium]MBP9509786.1 tRNA (guanosine(46)-N7)-methyltransferase TrmB [Fusobacteriaceae bacterium]
MEDRLKDLWRHFFKYPRKNYNPYILKMLEYPEYIAFDKEVINAEKGKWNERFGNDNPLYLEIGSGSGNFTNGLSERHKDRNYIALELKFKRLVLAADKVRRRDAKNVFFIRRRAEEILEFIGEQELEGVYINFADPWEEKLKNRVIQPKLFKSLDILLKKGGLIFIKTDHDGYYYDIMEFVKELDSYEVVYHTSDLHSSDKAGENILTEFEQLFINKHSKNINYIEILKTK